jgi:hypothetical protein
LRVNVSTAGIGKVVGFGLALDLALDEAVIKTAFYAEGKWKQGVPVDTGAYRSSIYTVTSKGNRGGKERAEAQAAKRRSNVRFRSLAANPGLKEAYVVAGVDYARVVNATHPTKRFAMEKARRIAEPYLRQQVALAVRSVRL